MNEAADTGSHFMTMALLVLYWVLLSFLPQMLRRPNSGLAGQNADQLVDKDTPATALSLALDAIRKVDGLFDEASFLRDASDAFETVVKAYAAGDLAPVERFVGPEVLEVFRAVIAERRQREETLELTFVGMKTATIIGACSESDAIEIVVRYVSQVITVTLAAGDAVVEGDPARIIELTDAWTFARDGQSNWTLIATANG